MPGECVRAAPDQDDFCHSHAALRLLFARRPAAAGLSRCGAWPEAAVSRSLSSPRSGRGRPPGQRRARACRGQRSSQSARGVSGVAGGGAVGRCHVPHHAQRKEQRTRRVMRMRIVIDRQLCKGHAVCMSEAPEVFSVSTMGTLTLLKASPSEAERLGSRQRSSIARPARSRSSREMARNSPFARAISVYREAT